MRCAGIGLFLSLCAAMTLPVRAARLPVLTIDAVAQQVILEDCTVAVTHPSFGPRGVTIWLAPSASLTGAVKVIARNLIPDQEYVVSTPGSQPRVVRGQHLEEGITVSLAGGGGPAPETESAVRLAIEWQGRLAQARQQAAAISALPAAVAEAANRLEQQCMALRRQCTWTRLVTLSIVPWGVGARPLQLREPPSEETVRLHRNAVVDAAAILTEHCAAIADGTGQHALLNVLAPLRASAPEGPLLDLLAQGEAGCATLSLSLSSPTANVPMRVEHLAVSAPEGWTLAPRNDAAATLAPGAALIVELEGCVPAEQWSRTQAVLHVTLAFGTHPEIRAFPLVLADGGLRLWAIGGPFPNPRNECFDVAYPPETTPFNPQAVFDTEDGKRGWRLYRSPDSHVRIKPVFSHRDWSIMYAQTQIVVPCAQDAVLRLGSDDGIKVWLNGTQVFANNTIRAVQAGNDTVPVRLRAGRNDLLLKVTQDTDQWGFIAEVCDTTGRVPAGLRVTLPQK